MTEHDPDALLTSEQAATILGVSRNTVVRRIKPVMRANGTSGKRYYTLRSIRDQLNAGDAA